MIPHHTTTQHIATRRDAHHRLTPLARSNYDIIERFGRFPDRNGILRRETTPEEASYLAKNGGTASSSPGKKGRGARVGRVKLFQRG